MQVKMFPVVNCSMQPQAVRPEEYRLMKLINLIEFLDDMEFQKLFQMLLCLTEV